TEEVHKNAFVARGVLIEQNSDRFILPQGPENIAAGAPSVNRQIAAHDAVTRNQILDSGIIDRPDDEFQRITVERMCKRAQLPGSKVGGHENDSTASIETFQIVLQTVVKHVL